MVSSTSEWSGLDRVAGVAERLAVLLSAGIPPHRAWIYVAEASSDSPADAAKVAPSEPVASKQIIAAVSRTEAGDPIGDAILRAVEKEGGVDNSAVPRRRPASTAALSEGLAWRGLAAAWMVASESGAPLAQGLLSFASSLSALAEARRDASAALAGPTATARLVLVLPVVGIVFGMALGFDTVGTLFTTVPGIVCLTLGGVLLAAGGYWNRRLLAASSPGNMTPGLSLDLLALSVSGGLPIDRARRSVSCALEDCGLSGGMEDADSVLSLASRAGVPAASLLRAESTRIRRNAKSDADRLAARLAVTLMLPLGLCVLPAFMLVGVAPLMMAVLSSTASVF